MKKNKSAIMALAGGAGACICGFIGIFVPRKAVCFLLILVLMINFVIHLSTWTQTSKAGKPMYSVLTMTVLDICTALLSLLAVLQAKEDMVFSFWMIYLITNGASLMSIPAKMPLWFGISGVLSAFLIYFFFGSGLLLAFTGISLIINGAERIMMTSASLRAGR